MSYYLDNQHTQLPAGLFTSGGTSQSYGAIVGTYVASTEKPITGESGDHLQFEVDLGNGTHYQADVNTQSKTGTAIGVYIADEALPTVGSTPAPFGVPQLGVVSDAQLSYQGLGLTNSEFVAQPYFRIEAQLDAALQASEFVAVYGQIFDDGGSNGKGIHETHFTGITNQDGAIAIYSKTGTGTAKRTWYFFKFQEDSIP